MSQILYIILGLSILFAINFTATIALILLYFKVAKIDESLKFKLGLALALSATNAVVQLFGLIVFSATGLIAYVLATFVLSVLAYWVVLKLSYKYHILEIAIIAISLAIILNPFWISLLGII